MVWGAADQSVVQPGTVLAADTEHRLGIGIGAPRQDSLLAGSDPFPDEVLAQAVPRRARRLDILVQEAGHRWDQPQTGRLYLPVAGAAFTCPRCDQLPPDTDWAAVNHADCQAEHGELAEFAIPGRSSPGVIELDVTIYLGAAAVHKHSVHLPVQEGPGATAKVTFSLVRVFDRLPVLIDRVASIDVGPDHLTVNAIGRPGMFSFRFTDTNWNPAAVAVRKELTDIHFRKVANGYQSRYPGVTVPAGDYAQLLRRLATVGRQLYNQIFNTADSAGLAPLLRNEARVRISRPSCRSPGPRGGRSRCPGRCCTTCRWNTRRRSYCAARRSASSARAGTAAGRRPRCARTRTCTSALIRPCCVHGGSGDWPTSWRYLSHRPGTGRWTR